MKLFDVRWNTVLRELPRFSMLSLEARRVLLEALKTSGYAPGAQFGAQRDEIIASGIPTFDAEKNRLLLAEEHRELLKVLRAMGRHVVFDDPSIPALVNYLQEHFTNEDINQLGGNTVGTAYGHVNAFTLAQGAAFAGWPGELLAAARDADLLAWGTARGIPSTAIDGLSQLRALKTLVQKLLGVQRPVPLSVWYTKLPASARATFASALHLGLRTAVLFAGLRRADLEPMIGLWPAAAEELLRPPAIKPTSVVPVEQFEAAIWMEDMTAVMATVVASPIRVRANDMSVFARTQVEISARLVPVPAWAAPMAIGPHQSRVDAAAGALNWRKWVRVQPQQHPQLTSTPAGVKWLALSPHDRLATLLAPMRASKARNPPGAYEMQGDDGGFFPYSMPYHREPKGVQLRDALTTTFLELGEGFYLLEPFLDYAARSANPFFALPRDVLNELQRHVYFGGVDPRAGFLSLWRNAMSGFLFGRLVAYAGATLGRMQDGAICFALTDIGRYLLGAKEHFSYGVAGVADIVVQPNFDVVFLGAAPSLEATVARVAERVGVAPGLVFRITRASIMRAAESGLTTDAVLATLRDASSKPVPQNVQREIAGWMSAVRRAQLRVMQVIDCGNDETANRVVALLGARAKRLTSSVIELPTATPSARTALIKKLRAGGVFVDDQTSKDIVSPPKRRRAAPVWSEDEDEVY